MLQSDREQTHTGNLYRPRTVSEQYSQSPLQDSKGTHGSFLLSFCTNIAFTSLSTFDILTSSVKSIKNAERVIASYAVWEDFRNDQPRRKMGERFGLASDKM